MSRRVNNDGTVTVGCLDDVFTPQDVKVEAKPETFTSSDVKPAKPKTTRKPVKK